MDWDDKEKVRAYHRRYYHEKRKKSLVDYLGGRCAKCGNTEDLQFDHKNREQKSFDIKTNMTLNNPKVKKELDKCQLLCLDCHKAKTAQENSGFTHGTVYAWMKKRCRCEVCYSAWRKWNDERNTKRRKTE